MAIASVDMVFVFRKIQTDWIPEASLMTPPRENNFPAYADGFGGSVSVSGDTIVVGAAGDGSNEAGVKNGSIGGSNNSLTNSGAAYVFRRIGNRWQLEAFLKSSNPGSEDFFAGKVAISGDTIVVSASGEDSDETGVKNGTMGGTNDSMPNSGAAYVFRRTANLWHQEAYLKAAAVSRDDLFGWSVAIEGDTIVVGAAWEDSDETGVKNGTTGGTNDSLINNGAAYVFKRTANSWVQEAYLKGANTFNASSGDCFGATAAISGDTIVIGAPCNDSDETGVKNGTVGGANELRPSTGAAYVFFRNGNLWSQQAFLKGWGYQMAGDGFGESGLAISGNTIVIGASCNSSGATGVIDDPDLSNAPSKYCSGAAYVYKRSGALWQQDVFIKGLEISKYDGFGRGVSVEGDLIVIGAPNEDSNERGVKNGPFGGLNDLLTDSGAAYAYTRTGSAWAPAAFFKRPLP